MDHRLNIQHIVLHLAAVACLCSCGKDIISFPDEAVTDSDFDGKPAVSVALSPGTRSSEGDYRGTTYRAQLFFRNTANDIYNASPSNPLARIDKMYAPYTGTYCDPKPFIEWLTPCLVSTSDFSWLEDNSKYGLKAGGFQDYYMVFNSPATNYVKYAEETVTHNETYGPQDYKKEYWGIPYYRTGPDYKHPSVSSEVAVSISGELVDGNYVYDIPELMVLKQQLSRVFFGVRCGDALSHVNLDGLTLNHLRNNGYYDPIKKTFVFKTSAPEDFDESVPVYKCTTEYGVRLDRAGEVGNYTAGPTLYLTDLNTAEPLDDYKTNTNYVSLLSTNYQDTPRDERPLLSMTLRKDDGTLVSADPFEIAYVYEPQKSYYYVITVNSMYIAVAVTVSDWNDVPNGINVDDYDGSDDYAVSVGIFPWTPKTLSDEIDGDGGGGGTSDPNVGFGVQVGGWRDKVNESQIDDDLEVITPGTVKSVAPGFYSLNITEAAAYSVSYVNGDSAPYNQESGEYAVLFDGATPKTLYDSSSTGSVQSRPYTIYVSAAGSIKFTKE